MHKVANENVWFKAVIEPIDFVKPTNHVYRCSGDDGCIK